ncbi:sperm-associated antigen 8 [Parambassis ranga]|uniref:Sperm-associated antigen 8 n=1 Tax=Parambassis ranga TaxID=210632 RepID=A0A6P7JE11_9TELE|nr:sperm-associated antigen 8-like [Parambassis ranga]
MTEHPAEAENTVTRRLVRNWDEKEERKKHIQKHGHKGILTVDEDSKMETTTTARVDFAPPKDLGVRLRGIRSQLLEKQLAQTISEKIKAERNPPTPETDYNTTTQTDFGIKGFVPLRPQTTQIHDYRTDQAMTYWREMYKRIQGVTPVKNLNAPFRKSCLFSTPITERLDEIELPPDDDDDEAALRYQLM